MDAPIWQKLRDKLTLQAVFQPIVSLTHGRVAAYEALSRPTHAEGYEFSILDVVDCARGAGPEGEAELDAMALSAIMAAVGELPVGVMLFVNVSPATVLEHPELLYPLAELPCTVVLEVTERSNIPDVRWQAFTLSLDILRWRGLLVAMDDCGAGYSGLNRLVALRPDFAKVDMELVRGVDRDSAKAQLVEALVSFARRAGIAVIAEGVETAAELHTLGELGVGYVQGFLLARPAGGFLAAKAAFPTPGGETPAADPAAALGAAMRLVRMAARGLGDAPGLFEAVVHAARDATGADLVVLRRLVHQTLQPVAMSGVPDEPLVIPLSAADPLAQAFNAARAIARQTRVEEGVAAAYGSLFGAPVVVDGVGWGILTVKFLEENRIRGDLADLVTGLADEAGLILAANRGGLLPSRTEAIDLLRFTVAHPGDHSVFLARVIRDVERVTGSHDCWIGIVNGPSFDIVSDAGDLAATDLTEWLDPTSEVGRMPPGVSLREARRVVVDDIRLDASLAPQLEGLLQMAIISAAATPMLYEGRVVGILKAYHSTVAAFTEDQLVFLEEVAGLLGAYVGRSQGERS